MKLRFVAKLLLLGALAATSFLATSSVLARGRAKQKRPATSAILDPLRLPTTYTSEKQAARVDAPSSGFARITAVNAQVVAGGLHVAGQAMLRDVRPRIAFVWSIRVRDANSNMPVSETRYDTQMFRIPKDTYSVAPTFEDTIPVALPPGSYKVELRLYEVPPTGVGLLDDAEINEHQLMAKNTARITLGG